MKTITNKFKFWFIGFTKGDGNFYVNKNTGYLEFKITQTELNFKVLEYIQINLSFGVISINDKNTNSIKFRVTDKKNLLRLIHIFNGNLYTEGKKEQFQNWVKAYNIKYKTNISLIENKNKLILTNSWLTGFIDAEGCFSVSLDKRSTHEKSVF